MSNSPILHRFASKAMDNPTDSILGLGHPDRSLCDLDRYRMGAGMTAALSFLLHAGLLFMLVNVTATPGKPGPPDSLGIDIVQSVASPPLPEEDKRPEPEPPKPSEPKPPAPKPVPVPPAPVSLAKPPPRQASIPKPVVDLPATSQDRSDGRDESSDSTAVVAAPPPPSPPPPAQSGGTNSPDDSLKLYGQIVWARIVAHKPRGVRLPGTVTVTFAIAADGQLISAEIIGSDGHSSLDRVALETVRIAAPFPLPPPHAMATPLIFSIPFQVR